MRRGERRDLMRLAGECTRLALSVVIVVAGVVIPWVLLSLGLVVGLFHQPPPD